MAGPGVLGCPAAAAQEHLSTQPDAAPTAGLEDPAALPGVVLRGWQTSLERGALL